MAVGYEMSLQDYLRVIFKRKWIILLCTFTIFVSSIVYTNQIPPIYRTFARVELSSSTTLANLLSEALLYKGNEMATAVEFAQSLPVMQRAVKDLGWVGAESTPAEIVTAASRLGNGVSASGDGQTNFITINYTHNDPVRCAQAATAIARAFTKEYRNRNSKDENEVRAFMEQQLKLTEERLFAAENELMRMKQQKDFVELAPGVRVTLDKAAELDAEYERSKAELAQAQQELEQFQSQLRTSDRTAGDLIRKSPRVSSLKKALLEAEMTLQSRSRDLTPRHPEVRAAQDKVRQLRTDLELAISETFSEKEGSLVARVQTLSTRIEALERALPQLRVIMENIPRQQLEQARVQRQVALQEKLYDFFQQKLEQKKYEDLVTSENSVTFVEPAREPGEPVYPNKRNNALVGIAIGLMLGFALAFVVEAMDTSIGTIEDVERTTGFAVMGVIPSIVVEEEAQQQGERAVVTFDPSSVRSRDIRDRLMELDNAARLSEAGLGRYKPQLITYYDPKSPISEAYRTLRTNVLFKGVGSVKVITVTSSGPQEGKTTTLSNLAVVMAQSGQRVLAVGCNLRRPALHKVLGIKKKPGVTDVLIGARRWQDVVQETGIENLHGFCSGPIPPNPSELLGSQAMTEMVREMREAYDVIIFDCPPVLPVTDAAVLSAKSDAVLLVYHVGKAGREALLRAKVQLENVGARILGVVLNRIPAEGRLGYSYYYYHYHYYGESTAEDQEAIRVMRRRKS